jgi:hypothetical protein
VAVDISLGERPSRPLDISQNQWLSDPIWDTITTCWSDKPEQRYELIVVHQVFSRSSRQGIKRGDLSIQHDRNSTIAERSQALKQGYSSVEISSHGSPLSSSSCESRSQRSREVLARWIRQVPPPSPLLSSQGSHELQRLGDNTLSAQERLKLLNKLCKTCSRHRVIPKSMHIPDCSKGSVEVERGGFADVSQGVYQGRRVAIKVVRVCLMDDLDGVLSVSL